MHRNVWMYCGAVLLAACSTLQGQSLVVQRMSSQFDQPVFATFAPGSPNRLYVVEKQGAIRVMHRISGVVNAINFLTVPNVQSGGDERGLLSMAFHPNFANNGYYYVNFTDSSGSDTRIVRYTAIDFIRTDADSAFNILEIDQPQSTHNGGWMGFGPDGYLYVSVGDGGGSDDNDSGHTPGIGNSQDINNNLLGTVLRIDVDGDDFPSNPNRNYAIPADNPFVNRLGDDEIYVYGMRNPWRCSFDNETGDLYIADVGQNQREEVTVIPAASGGGHNLGWRLREGTIETPGSVGGNAPADAIDPIYDYQHGNGSFRGFSVTGGYVYRGSIEELKGNYFFGDFVTNNLWSLNYDGSAPENFNGQNFTNLTQWDNIVSTNGGEPENFSSFAEDAFGDLYLLDFTDGEIFRVEDGSFSNSPDAFTGNVTVSVNNGDLRVTGERDTAQCIIVTATGTPGRFQFSSIAQNPGFGTTFNGQPTLTVNGVTDDMRFDIDSGNKVLILSNGNVAEFVVPDDLRITSTGSSPVSVILDSLNVGGRTDVTTRSGDDAVIVHDCFFNQRFRPSTGSGDDVVTDGQFGLASICNDDLDIRTSGGNDDVACLGTVVSDRCNIRMGSGNDGTAIRECMFGVTRIFGNGGNDNFAPQNNLISSLQLRQYEIETGSVATILFQIQQNPTFQEAEMFFTLLGLAD